MTSRDFCYWLQGIFEVAKLESLTAEHTTIVKNHLAMVFVHEIDPSFGGPEKQAKAKLDAAHAPPVLTPVAPPKPQDPYGPVMRC